MKRTYKRAVSFMLVCAMMLSCMCLEAFAATDAEFSYSLANSTLDIQNDDWAVISVQNTQSVGIAAIKFYLYCDANVFKTTEAQYDDETGEYVRGGFNFKGVYGNGGSVEVNTIATAKANNNYDGDPNKDGYVVLWYKSSNATAKPVCDIYLSVDPKAVNGEYSIELAASQANNAAEEDINVIFSQAVTVTVTGGIDADNVTPSITTQPQSAGYKFGEPSSDLVVAASLPENTVVTEPLAYQWYKVVEDGDDEAITGATNPNYKPILGEIGVGKSAAYYCVVTSTYNGQKFPVKSSVATVTYSKADSTPPELTQNTVTYGETLTLVTKSGVGSSDVSFEIIAGDDVATLSGKILTPLKVGTVTLRVTRAASDNYNGSTTEQTITVNPADLTNVTDNQTMTVYNNGNTFALPEITATAVGGKTVSVSYEVTSGSDLIILDPAAKTVKGNDSKTTGTAVITATISAQYHNTVTRTITVNVLNKADVSGSITFEKKAGAPTTYDDSEHTLSDFVNVATFSGTASGTSSITYTLNGAAATMDTAITNAGTYTVTATYEDNTQYGTKTVEFTIARAKVTAPVAKTGLVYNGSVQTGVELPTGAKYTLENYTGSNAGEYHATATLLNTTNYMWADETDAPKDIPWSIARKSIAVPTANTGLVYTGATLTGVNGGEGYSLTNNKETNAGNYTAVATLDSNYQWNDGTTAKKSILWEIAKANIVVTASWNYSSAFTYDGNEKTVSVTGVDTAKVTVTYTDNAKTNAGTYTAKASFAPKDTKNYTVSGTVDDLTWVINKAEVAVPAAATGLKYTGEVQTGVASADETKYTVTGGTATDAHSYTATASLVDKINYKWSGLSGSNESNDQTIPWTIAKADDLALSGSASLRYSNTAEQTILASDLHEKAGEIEIISVSTGTNEILAADAEKAADGSKATYALKTGLSAADAGKQAIITVTFSSKNYENSTYTLTVTVMDKSDVSSQITFADGSATYTGQVQTYEQATAASGLHGTITYTYSPAVVKDAGTYSVTATYEDADNYGTKTVSFTITPAALTVTGGTVAPKTYDGGTTAEVTNVTFGGLVNGETLAASDYTVTNAAFADANAGTGKTVTFTVALKETVKNYTLGVHTAGSAVGSISAKHISVTVGDVAAQTYTGSALTPAVTVTAADTIGGYLLVKDTDYTVSYTGNTNAGTARVTVASKAGSNYTFTAVDKTFTINKADLTVAAEDLTVTYTGSDLANSAIKGTAKFGRTSVAGTWSWSVKPASNNASATPYTAKVQFTPADTTNFNIPAAVEIHVTINKATPTGEPVYTEISSAGKTLADAKLEPGTLTPAGGTLIWVDGDGNELPGTTVVEADTVYTWKYVPADTVNYNVISGNVVLYTSVTILPVVYAINVNSTANGTVKLNVSSARPGKVVTITVDPANGYAVERVRIYDVKGNPIQFTDHGNGTYSFVMPNSAVTVNVSFAKTTSDPVISFVDVPAGSWYADAVAMMVDRGLFNGTSSTTFSPDGNMTRAMLWTVLARMEGVDTTGGATWYEKGMIWAESEGITDGSNPNGNITREQLITMLWRYSGSPSASQLSLKIFADVDDISDWAVTAMAWSAENGILNGTNGCALPGSNATRAQVAAILMRFIEKFAK